MDHRSILFKVNKKWLNVKNIVGLTQQWLDNIADEPMDVKRAFMRKAVDNLNESGSIELFNKGAI